MAFMDSGAAGFTVRLKSVVLQAILPRPRDEEMPADPFPSIPFDAVPEAPTRPRVVAAVIGLPPSERVEAAFEAMPPSQTELRLIEALLMYPDSTSGELSRACGWTRPIWHTHFNLMCQRREAWLWPSADAEGPDAQFLASVLADYRPATGRFTLRPEVAEVFGRLGIGPGA